MRTTRAIHAVERLKTRSGNPQFAAISLSGGLFYLVDKSSGTDKKVSDPLTLDEAAQGEQARPGVRRADQEE
jgi:hypothetical protein